MPVPTIPPTTIATVANRPSRSSGASGRSSARADTGNLRVTQRLLRLDQVRSHRTSSRGCSYLGCLADDFGEQRGNGSFSTTVVPPADLRVGSPAGAIAEIHGRPVPVSVRVPSDEVVVQSDGILEPVLPHGTLDVLNGPLGPELDQDDAVAKGLEPQRLA